MVDLEHCAITRADCATLSDEATSMSRVMTQLRVDDVSCTCRLMSNADLRSSMMNVSMSASMTC